MKRVAWIFALIFLVLLGDRLGGTVLKKMTEESQFRYSRLYNGQGMCDILLVGNSRGLMFYQPYIEQLTGQSTLNISYNGLPVDLANVFVNDHFDLYPSPKKVIIDITIADRLNNQLIAGFSPYQQFSSRLDTLMLNSATKSYFGGKVSHLFLYNSEIFQRALYYLDKSDEDWLLNRVINQKVIDDIVNEPPYEISMDDYLLSHLTDLVKKAQKNDAEVFLVINPYYPPFEEKITNLEDIITKVETATGLKVHNFSRAVQDVEGYGDYQHLNIYGSKIYIDELMKAGILSKSKKKYPIPNTE